MKQEMVEGPEVVSSGLTNRILTLFSLERKPGIVFFFFPHKSTVTV